MTLTIPELRALVAAATPGAWIADRSPAGYSNVLLEPGTIIMSGDADPRCWSDAAFIAASRTAVPELLDRVEQLEAENEKLKHAEIMSRLRSRRFSEQFCEAESKANNLRAGLREALKIAHSTNRFCEDFGLCGERSWCGERGCHRLAELAKLVGVKP